MLPDPCTVTPGITTTQLVVITAVMIKTANAWIVLIFIVISFSKKAFSSSQTPTNEALRHYQF
jgi:hypothetical protein